MSHELIGYIPAGGLGERLRPLTTNFPKPLLLMGEKDRRIIDFPMSCVKRITSRVLIATAFCHERLIAYFGEGDEGLIFLRDSYLLDIGGSLLQHYKLISEPGLLGDNILMIPGDHVVENVDFDEMNRLHIENNADISIGLVERRGYGDYVCLDRLGKVVEMGKRGDFSYTGICIIKSSFLLSQLNRIIEDGWDYTSFDFGKGIVVAALGRFNVRGYCFGRNSYWDDAGTIDRYFFNNMRLSGGKNVVSPSAEIVDVSVFTRSIILDEARVKLTSEISNVIISPASLVERRSDCVLVQ